MSAGYSHSPFVHQYAIPPQVFLRLRRANEQLQTLASDVHRTFIEGPNRIVFEDDPDRKAKTVTRVWRGDIFLHPEFEWSVRVGEIIHDLRAAMDNLVCALTYQFSQTTCEGTSFPICDKPAAYVSLRKRTNKGQSLDPIGRIDPIAAAIIDALQPYMSGDAMRHPLWWLSELSNFDKHRLFHLNDWFFRMRRFKLTALDEWVEILDQRPQVSGILKHGAEVARGTTRSTRPEFVVNVDFDFAIEIAFDQSNRIVPGESVFAVLRQILFHVANIAEAFAHFLPSPIQVVRITPGTGFQPNPDYRG